MRLTKYRSAKRRERAPLVRGSSSASRELCCPATESFAGKLQHKQMERATKAFWRQPTSCTCVWKRGCAYRGVYLRATSFHRSLLQNGDKRAHIHAHAYMRAHICKTQWEQIDANTEQNVDTCHIPVACQQYREVTQTAPYPPSKIQGDATRVNPFHVGRSREISDPIALRGKFDR